jgi:hypothetical protein
MSPTRTSSISKTTGDAPVDDEALEVLLALQKTQPLRRRVLDALSLPADRHRMHRDALRAGIENRGAIVPASWTACTVLRRRTLRS